MDYGKEIAEAGLKIKAIKINFDNPFEWSSGFRMPIYNNNRMFLFHPKYRRMMDGAFFQLNKNNNILDYDVGVIAGISTGGIPWATSWSKIYNLPLIYVRDKPKKHGLKNQIEGIDAESNLENYNVLLIEDLVSTGESSVRAVQTIRDKKGICDYCVSIFNYGFDEAKKMFKGEIPYDKEGRKLTIPCNNKSLLTYDTLLEVAKETGYVDNQQIKMLEEWRADPWNWGEKHGFPKVEK